MEGNFTGVTDGPSFYEVFCNSTSSNSSTTSHIIALGTLPVITTNDNIVSGYYLDGEGYDDMAVISLLAFESLSPVEFQWWPKNSSQMPLLRARRSSSSIPVPIQVVISFRALTFSDNSFLILPRKTTLDSEIVSEDIILYDGYCASTWTLLASLCASKPV